MLQKYYQIFFLFWCVVTLLTGAINYVFNAYPQQTPNFKSFGQGRVGDTSTRLTNTI